MRSSVSPSTRASASRYSRHFTSGCPLSQGRQERSETAGDAALLVDDDDLAVVAELLHLVITDEPLRLELGRRGEARVDAYAPETVAQRLRDAVLAAAGGTP